jgi:predicted membrane protein
MTTHATGAPAAVRLAFGLGVMLIGGLLTLDNFGLLEARRFIRWWPVLFIVLGTAKLFSSMKAKRPVGYVFITLGIVLLAVNFGLLQFRQAFALFLLAVGANIVWRAARSPHAPPSTVADPSRQLDVSAVLGYVQRSVSARDFRGGNATAVMGGCEIDLSEASIDGREAVINVFAFWGGIEMTVPEDWSVESRGVAVLGAFEDGSRCRCPEDERKKLIVTGFVLMGGVEIKN